MLAGESFGDYQVLELIGSGGMGDVFRARDAQLGRDVAIKVLSDRFRLDVQRLARFEREARVLASLSHPNIATLHAVERCGDSQVLVLELVEGETLGERIARGKIPVPEALAIARQVAAALEAAHERGVIHRDLKPSNIKLRSDGTVKLLDFGLAKACHPAVEDAGALAITLTIEVAGGGIMGTPAYMSPEHARGLPVDKRTDIWAFGCVLYEMLTGRAAFEGERASDVVARIIEREPDFEALPREVPGTVRQLLRRCLRKDSRERLRDIGDARLTLEDGDASSAAPEVRPAAANLSSVMRRRRFLGSAVAGAAVLAVVVAGAWWHTVTQTRSAIERAPQQSIAILPFADLSEKQDQAYFAEGMTEEIRNLLVTVPTLRVIGRTSSFQVRGRLQDVRKIGAALGAAYVVEGSVRRSGEQVRVVAQLIDARDGTQRWSRTFDRNVTDILRIQQEIATAAARALQLEVAFVSADGITRNSEAYDHYLRGVHASERYDRQGFEAALSHFRRALELDPTMIDAAVALAEAWSMMAAWGFVPGSTGWERTREAAEAALKLDPKSARAHAVLGDRYLEYEWNWPAAQRELQLALELAPHDPTVLGQVAQERVVMGYPEEALQYIDTALAIDPLNASKHFGRAWSYLRLGRFTEGEASARRALEISPTYSYGRYFLSLQLLMQGKAAEALAEAQKETEPDGRTMGLALAYHALGQRQEADAALARLEKEHGDDLAMYVAEVYAFRGDKDRAFEWLERAHAQRDPTLFFIKQEILLAPLEDDSRYRAFLRKMNLPM